MKAGRIDIADEKTAAGIAMLSQMRAAWAARPTDGERFSVPREEGKDAVPVLIYRPAAPTDKKLPVFFNMHGGAWLGGDAIMMESFCRLLADSIPAVVVNINYHKADVIPVSEMSAEAADCVAWFQDHAEDFGVDSERMAIGGHSAGAHISAGTVLRLKAAGRKMKMQVLVYPCVDLRPESNCDWLNMTIGTVVPEGGLEQKFLSPMTARESELMTECTAAIVICGVDDLKPHGIAYAKKLLEAGTTVHCRTYPKAEHGFLEVNRPDYGAPEDPRISPEQAAYARDCEQWLIGLMKAEL